jgi:hypothetical protein
MAVTDQTPANASTANGVTTVFPYSFRILDEADLRVTGTIAGVTTVYTLNVDYTVSGVGDASGGNVTFTTAPASGVVVLRKRAMAYTRAVDYQNNGDLIADELDDDQDAPVMMVQQLAEVVDRALTVPEYLLGTFDAELPEPAPLAPLVWNAAGDGFEAGSTEKTGDMLLRPNLAAGTDALFAQNALGAAVRGFLHKLRETVSPEDFGAVGDGTDRPVSQWLSGGALDRGYADLAAIQVDYPHVALLTNSIDWAGFQAAIDYCQTSGKPLRCSGNYAMNRGLEIDSPINLDGGGSFQSGSGTTPAYIAGARLVATAAIAHILHVKAGTSGVALYGVRINGLLLDANNIADRCMVVESTVRGSFTELEGLRAITVGFDFCDGNATYFYKNWLNAVFYNSTASVAAQNSDGIWFRDTNTGTNLGCVQNHVGWLGTFTANGNGIVIGGSDNNEYGALNGFTTGTGVGLVFKGPNGFVNLQPRNNFIRYLAATVRNETTSRTNTILNASSEATSVTLSGGGTAEVEFRIFNYVTGKYWETPRYTMKGVRQFSTGDLRNLNGTESTVNSIWPSIDLADAATQGFGLCAGMPYDWHSGNIKAVTIYLAPSTSFAGNFRLRVRGMTPATGDATATPTLDESFTVTPNANAGRMTKHTLTFTAALAITKGDMALFRVDRVGADAADTHTGVCQIMGMAVHYTATGPGSDGGGGGPWQVIDPTI